MSDFTAMAAALSERLIAHKQAKDSDAKPAVKKKTAVKHAAKKKRAQAKPRQPKIVPPNGGYTMEQMQRFNDETNRAYELILGGATQREAADAVGLTLSQLTGRMIRRGLRMPRQDDREKRHEQAVRARRMYEREGKTAVEAAKEIGWPVGKLYAHWSRHGMTSEQLPGFNERHAAAVRGRKLYESGVPIEEVSVQVGRSVRSLRKHWSKYGLTQARRSPAQIDQETRTAHSAIEDGSTITAEAAKLGVARQTLSYRLTENGLKRNPADAARAKMRKAVLARDLFDEGMPASEAAAAVGWVGPPISLKNYWVYHKMTRGRHHAFREVGDE